MINYKVTVSINKFVNTIFVVIIDFMILRDSFFNFALFRYFCLGNTRLNPSALRSIPFLNRICRTRVPIIHSL